LREGTAASKKSVAVEHVCVRGHIHKHKECIDKTSSVERVEEAERQKEKRVFV